MSLEYGKNLDLSGKMCIALYEIQFGLDFNSKVKCKNLDLTF